VAVLVDHRAIPMQHQEAFKETIQFLVQLFVLVAGTVLVLAGKVAPAVVGAETGVIILMVQATVDRQFLDKETKVGLMPMVKAAEVVEQVVSD
jgi:hypothetical protein